MAFSKPTTVKELEALVDMVIEENMDEMEFKDDLLKKFGIENCVFSMDITDLYTPINIDCTTKIYFYDSFVTLDRFVFSTPTMLDLCVALEKHLKVRSNDHIFLEDYTFKNDDIILICGS